MISDVGCGADLLASALRAAALNVFVNTRTLKDRDFAAETESQVDSILSEYVPRAEAVAEEVQKKLREKK